MTTHARHRRRFGIALLLVLAGCPPAASTVPPYARESGDADSGRPDASSRRGDANADASVPDASKDEELAKSNNETGTLRVVRRSRGYETIHAIWQRLGRTEETQLEELPSTIGARLEVRLADLNHDGVPDVVIDRGGAPSLRFAVYLSEHDRIDGAHDTMVFRWLDGIANIDAAVAALSKIQHTDYSIPEVCGMLTRAPRGGVDAWTWVDDDKGWVHAKKKRPPGWDCRQLDKDGDAYWMPELECSRFVPACKTLLLAGGHHGTALPDPRYIFFARVKGKLELEAVANHDN